MISLNKFDSVKIDHTFNIKAESALSAAKITLKDSLRSDLVALVDDGIFQSFDDENMFIFTDDNEYAQIIFVYELTNGRYTVQKGFSSVTLSELELLKRGDSVVQDDEYITDGRKVVLKSDYIKKYEGYGYSPDFIKDELSDCKELVRVNGRWEIKENKDCILG